MFRNLHKSIVKVAEQYTKKLKSVAPTDTEALKNSITYKANDEGFVIDAFDYLYYQDKGVNGVKKSRGSEYSYTNKKPKITKSLRDWSKKRGLNVWAVQTSIYNKGIPAKNFITKADTAVDFSEITEAYSKDIEEQMFQD